MNDKIRELALRVAEEMELECGHPAIDRNYIEFLTRCLQELSITEQDKLDAARLDFMQEKTTGASDSERYLPFRIYWGDTKDIRKAIDRAMGN